MAKMGRPPKDPKDKKCKVHIALDRDVYEYLEKLDNKSAWLNKAAISRMKEENRRVRAKAARNYS